jgi:eukaryotic-like serine/threonine-protein kinase
VSSPDPLIGQIIDGRYTVQRKIARGGMATVYEALDSRLDRPVALKVMHRHLAEDPEFRSRFEREAKSAARLSHPHVVGVFDQGESDGLVYLAMEYVPGRTLRDVMRRFGPLSSEQSLVIMDAVLEALDAAHAAGFVHRDIKPENVLLSDDGRVKVADFGLARALATSATNATTGMIIGTVAYLSPEQVERGEADARSDVYAAGILLYEMVTNTVPHAGESPLSVAYQHVNADVPPPSTARPDIPGSVDAIVVRATRRDSSQRYSSAREFLSDVRRVRAALPPPRPFAAPDEQITVVVPRPEHLEQETTHFARTSSPHLAPDRRRRKPALIIALVGVIVALAALGGWFLANELGKVPMPDVIGKTVEQATTLLSASELTLTIDAEAFSEDVERGLILSTDPAPGDGVKPAAPVGATVSKGPERYEVPDVRGLPAAEASAELTSAQLATGPTRQVFDGDVPKGQVAATEPEIGSALRKGESVALLISKGPEPVEVPSLQGRKLAGAKSALQKVGLTASVSQRFSMKVPAGEVISVSPAPGTVVNAGSAVQLISSKGPPPVEVPNLVDMRKKDALAALARLGLQAKVEQGAVTPLNRVLNQSPAAGATVPKGSTVIIRII